MVKKILFISLALFGLLFSGMAEVCFADASAQLEQANAYKKSGQYEQAEAIYLQIVKDYPGTDDAFQAQRNLPCVYIAMDKQADAQAAFEKMLADFSEHEHLPHAVHEVVEQCRKLGKADKAKQLCSNLLTNQPENNQAIWAQMGVAISHNYLGNETATKAAIEKLIAEFSEDNRSAEAVGQIAWSYRKLKKYERAKQLYQYVVDNWPDKERAIFSQRGVALCNIALGDETAAWTAVERLLTRFSEDEHAAEVVYPLAQRYRKVKKYEKARQLYQYVVGSQPESKQAIWAQMGVAISNNYLGDETATKAAIEKLIAEFSEDNRSAEAVGQIAWSYRKLKKYERAKQLYQYVVDNWPDKERAIFSQRGVALCNIALGDETAAWTAVERLLTRFSEDEHAAEVVYPLAQRYRKVKKYEKARQLYQYVVDRQPENKRAIWAQVDLVELNIKDGDDTATQAAIEKLLTQFSGRKGIAKTVVELADKCRRKFGKHDKARELYQYVLAHWPDGEYAMWARRGIAFLDIKFQDYEAAEAAIEKILADFPQHKSLARAFYWLGNDYRRVGKYQRAIELYQYVVDNWPASQHTPWAQMNLALSNFELDNDADAQAAINKLLTQFSEHKGIPQVVHDLASGCRELGKYEKAIQMDQYVIKHWPDSGTAIWSQRGVAISNIRPGNDAAVQAALDKLIADFNDHSSLPRAIFHVGEEYYNEAFRDVKQGLDTEARDSFTKAITVWERIITKLQPSAPYTARAYNLTADCYRRLGQHQKAIDYYQRVVDDWPDYEYAWNALLRIGRTYENLKESGLVSGSEADLKTKAAYEQLLEKYPDCKAATHARRWLSRYNSN